MGLKQPFQVLTLKHSYPIENSCIFGQKFILSEKRLGCFPSLNRWSPIKRLVGQKN